MDSVPVLFISGNANLNPNEKLRVRGVQSVDIVSVVKPITKAAWQEGMSRFARMNIEQLIDICLRGRPGPCWLDIPLNVQAEEV